MRAGQADRNVILAELHSHLLAFGSLNQFSLLIRTMINQSVSYLLSGRDQVSTRAGLHLHEASSVPVTAALDYFLGTCSILNLNSFPALEDWIIS